MLALRLARMPFSSHWAHLVLIHSGWTSGTRAGHLTVKVEVAYVAGCRPSTS